MAIGNVIAELSRPAAAGKWDFVVSAHGRTVPLEADRTAYGPRASTFSACRNVRHSSSTTRKIVASSGQWRLRHNTAAPHIVGCQYCQTVFPRH